MNKRIWASKKEAQEETRWSITHRLMFALSFFVFFLYIFLCEAGL